MLLTNGQFVDKILAYGIDVNKIFTMLDLSGILIKKYGKILFVEEILSVIKEQDKELYYFLKFLKLANKHNILAIRHIKVLLKQQADGYVKKFGVVVPGVSRFDKISAFLNKKFENCNVEHINTDKIHVFVKGDGWYYKRNAIQDAKKLLGL